MSVLGEMKRRNLYRVGMVYVITGWILIQLGYVVAYNFGASGWLLGLYIMGVVIGFPVVMYLAWTFERTAEGIKRVSEVDPAASITPETGHKLDIIIALLAAVVGIVSLDQFMPKPPEIAIEETAVPVEPEPDPVILENSIAVLPFVNMSAESSQDYFSDGLSEELLNVLTRVEGLNVVSRTSSFAFKNELRNIQRIARSLRVANILEGSVRKVGNKIRITAQLIDAENDVHLWSNSYDRDMTTFFRSRMK